MKALRVFALALSLLPACATSVTGLSRDDAGAETHAADATPDTSPDAAPDAALDAVPDTAADAAPDTGIACDEDGDGERSLACGGTDCDDHDRYRNHGLTEQCSGTLPDGRSAASHDEDCDPCTVNNPAHAGDGDGDRDRFASSTCSNPWLGATAPTGCDRSQVSENASAQTEVGTDCDDTLSAVNPNAPELCGNHVDDNCNGAIDEGVPATAYHDADNDGHGDPAVGMSVASACSVPAGWSSTHDDCDDTRAETRPGALEQCDGRDNDCSLPGAMAGGVDPSEDMDGDHCSPLGAACVGFGDPGSLPASFPRTDCDDANAAVRPGLLEVCDRVDSDCSSGGGVDPTEDMDNDGYAPLAATCAGLGEAGAPMTAFPRTDCDDAHASVSPGHTAAEDRASCDGLDNDCNPATSELTAPCASGGFCGPGGACASAPTLQALDAGGNSLCASYNDGTARCWGSNRSGQLGDGTLTDHSNAAVVPSLTSVAALAGGADHTCARMSDGTVRCWGLNSNGQVGDGTLIQRLLPTVVPGLGGVAELRAGARFCCARLIDGSAQCWGENVDGQLGDGTTDRHMIPTAVPGLSHVAGLTAGPNHACAHLDDGTARCWGFNAGGQLGDGTTTNRNSPTVVSGLVGVAELATGGFHTCARLTDGTVSCWGSNSNGELGDGTTLFRPIPAPVLGLTGVVELAAGLDHTCARLSDGTARCWGYNRYGQLGDGTTTSRTSPTEVPGLVGVAELAVSAFHSCARLSDGTVRCWGDNSANYFGGTAPANVLVPTLVSGL